MNAIHDGELTFTTAPERLDLPDFISRGQHCAFKYKYWDSAKQGYRVGWGLKQVIWVSGHFNDNKELHAFESKLKEQNEINWLSSTVTFYVGKDRYCYIPTENQYREQLGDSHRVVFNKHKARVFIESMNHAETKGE